MVRTQIGSTLAWASVLVLLWPIHAFAQEQTQEQTLAVINAGVSSAEDAPFVTTDYRFLPGDAVYVTFQIAGFKSKSNEATGTRQISLSYDVTMEDESGVPMAEAVSGEIKEQLSPEDKNWIPKRRASFTVPLLVAAGRYCIRINAKDAIAGTKASTNVPFELGGEHIQPVDSITVEHFRFLRKEDSREPLTVPAYRPGDTVYTEFDIAGFQHTAGNQYHVTYNISVVDPNGKPFLAQTDVANVMNESFYPAQFLPERADVLTKSTNLRGGYTIVLTVEDVLAHKSYVYRQAFTLE